LGLLRFACQVQAGNADVAGVVLAEILDEIKPPEIDARCPQHPAKRGERLDPVSSSGKVIGSGVRPWGV
jgi:hypothetical protein